MLSLIGRTKDIFAEVPAVCKPLRSLTTWAGCPRDIVLNFRLFPSGHSKETRAPGKRFHTNGPNFERGEPERGLIFHTRDFKELGFLCETLWVTGGGFTTPAGWVFTQPQKSAGKKEGTPPRKTAQKGRGDTHTCDTGRRATNTFYTTKALIGPRKFYRGGGHRLSIF